MSLHLAKIAAAVTPNAHAVLLLDQAGWLLSDRLAVSANTPSSRCRPSAQN
jgi:hypothetical protein